MIFLLVVDWIMKTTTDTPRGLQWTFTKRLEDLDFADDICLLSHNFQQMQEKTDRLHQIAQTTGLTINVKKTKSMRINNAITRSFTIQNEPIEDVSTFTYLGSITSISGGTEEDIRSRIGKARHVFTTLRPIWKNKNIRLPTKLKLFNSNVISTLLYGSETWIHTKALDEKLKVFVNTCLRQILQIRWPETISNQDLWRTTRQVPITETIKKRKWRWIGYTLRKDPNSIVRQSLDWNPQGKRRRGRPVLTWRRTLDKELKTLSLSWNEAKARAQDRPRWRKVVDDLCPIGGEEDLVSN